jgi:hypothetical protein
MSSTLVLVPTVCCSSSSSRRRRRSQYDDDNDDDDMLSNPNLGNCPNVHPKFRNPPNLCPLKIRFSLSVRHNARTTEPRVVTSAAVLF